ncbi:hypothetical protein EDEG_02714 [Edhazardia aedis USNM 41457]|uniref:Uncharacterized protein n=1 Tax=Edhazardia aedis (strain USNM 41457) TaxID=1003232 RepID=J9DJU2_EDHAE|nr:hypothetical protein EDEG_02714 [Edhazardia aedis USNM 41457]|eukprot:EJW02890.1 hypothetical protein EDEG_02714 [Edhazardia aedis USNM 41457]
MQNLNFFNYVYRCYSLVIMARKVNYNLPHKDLIVHELNIKKFIRKNMLNKEVSKDFKRYTDKYYQSKFDIGDFIDCELLSPEIRDFLALKMTASKDTNITDSFEKSKSVFLDEIDQYDFVANEKLLGDDEDDENEQEEDEDEEENDYNIDYENEDEFVDEDGHGDDNYD